MEGSFVLRNVSGTFLEARLGSLDAILGLYWNMLGTPAAVPEYFLIRILIRKFFVGLLEGHIGSL